MADILGKPMIQRVYEKASESKKADKVMVATDDLRIFAAVKEFDGNVVMTSRDHKSGTDRITEAVEQESGDIIINLQGDQPLICPEDIDLLIDKMVGDSTCSVATLCHPISQKEAENPNTVKVVLSANGRALYFSRSLIPYTSQNIANVTYNKHVGIYGFRRNVLARYKNLPFSQLEYQEKLEQLRLLEAGFAIDVLETDRVNDQGVDTPEDLEIVKQILLDTQPPSPSAFGSALQ